MAESHPDMTQADLASWAKSHYGSSKPPSQTTISRILSKKDELISLKEHEFNLIRRRKLTNPLLRKVLIEWISQCVWNNIPITTPIITGAAASFWKLLPSDMREGNGEFSYKWCSQFFNKMNLNLNNLDKELYSVKYKIYHYEERDEIKELLENYDMKSIFTIDEVLISNDLPLDQAFYDDTSDYITCMLCCNVDGSEKLEPFVVGRYEHYEINKNSNSMRDNSRHGVTYHSNRMKWLTSTLFYDWLAVLDKRLEFFKKDIVILLDDSIAHRIINIKLQHITLIFTESKQSFLPMNRGISSDFKMNFRIEEYKSLIKKQINKRGMILTKDELKISMNETLELIKRAWDEISELKIQSYWKQSGILPGDISSQLKRMNVFDKDLENKLQSAIDQLRVNIKWDTLSLLDLSIEQKINKSFLSNEEIIDCCIVDEFGNEESLNGELKRAPYSKTLGKGFQRLQRLYELQKVANDLGFGNNLNLNESNFQDIDPFKLTNDDFDLAFPVNTLSDNVNSNATSTTNNSTINLLDNDLPITDADSSFIDKLQVLASFITLMETDEEFQVSSQTANEIRLLYFQYLNRSRDDFT